MIECSIMAEYEFGLFTNPHAPKAASEGDADMLWRLPAGAAFMDIIPPTHSRWQRFPKRLIVRGGDGSMREICQWMHDRAEVRPIGLVPRGTQNVLYHVLQELGHQSNVKTFLEKTVDDYLEDQRLRPGMINDLVFVNHVGLGHMEQHLGRFNARLRFLPTRIRVPAAGVLAVLATVARHRDGALFNVFSISPKIGSVEAFPDQRLLDNHQITHGRIPSVRKLIIALSYWQMGKRLPANILEVEQSSCFINPDMGRFMRIDGDTGPSPSPTGVLIKRASYGIPVVAIT